MLPVYASGAAAVVFCYDVQSKATLDHLEEHARYLNNISIPVKYIFGCKSDLATQIQPPGKNASPGSTIMPQPVYDRYGLRPVDKAMAEEAGRRMGAMKVLETSSVSGKGVLDAFSDVFMVVYETLPAPQDPSKFIGTCIRPGMRLIQPDKEHRDII